MSVAIRSGSTFDPDAPRALFQTTLPQGALRHTYAVSNDGRRVLMTAPLANSSTATIPLFVILNWPSLVKR